MAYLGLVGCARALAHCVAVGDPTEDLDTHPPTREPRPSLMPTFALHVCRSEAKDFPLPPLLQRRSHTTRKVQPQVRGGRTEGRAFRGLVSGGWASRAAHDTTSPLKLYRVKPKPTPQPPSRGRGFFTPFTLSCGLQLLKGQCIRWPLTPAPLSNPTGPEHRRIRAPFPLPLL